MPSRLLILVEGETEETFVGEMLADHLAAHQVYASAKRFGTGRHRGGICAWNTARREILTHLRHDPELRVTTMVDYYGLPQGEAEGHGWPGRSQAAQLPFSQKATTVEQALTADITAALNNALAAQRFIPFVVIHEFEGILFSDPNAFASGIGQPQLAAPFQQIRVQFQNPEAINDSPITAPSKRVIDLYSGYEKPLFGTLAALEIGLNTIRAQCPHFADWISQLENL
jgi:hypothetical protein